MFQAKAKSQGGKKFLSRSEMKMILGGKVIPDGCPSECGTGCGGNTGCGCCGSPRNYCQNGGCPPPPPL